MPDLDWFSALIRPRFALDEGQVECLYRHFALLLLWNRRMDLTSIEAPEEIVQRHYLESLFFATNIPAGPSGSSILDFGSGAGFPGIPIAILRAEWRVTLVEANQRRAVFLKEATRDLPNVEVFAERGQAAGGSYDRVVARAVKPTEVLGCLPRLASRAGLLVGQASLTVLQSKARFCWEEPLLVPGSERRFCIFGECST